VSSLRASTISLAMVSTPSLRFGTFFTKAIVYLSPLKHSQVTK
jgi:hypothetical protein